MQIVFGHACELFLYGILGATQCTKHTKYLEHMLSRESWGHFPLEEFCMRCFCKLKPPLPPCCYIYATNHL